MTVPLRHENFIMPLKINVESCADGRADSYADEDESDLTE